MLDDLLAPAARRVSPCVPCIRSARPCPYYLLGKNRSGSGILYRTSRSALSFQVKATRMELRARTTAVLAFQLAGCEYQPPLGDQTCLGYLSMD